ncbi:hypothetical protein KQI61_05675 [Anaerocolumna aminovalerica]|uniref:hypothetical protein n=1 Tax=Anaerocolumna aminovalerica TaxID=1527 RepID=UPI001C0F0AE1|nr:hypothetical protein [Anaerocolumna aminovalerica]MBU5331679.1 hypothetical protein [Anaerocolumna aminovalerica]
MFRKDVNLLCKFCDDLKWRTYIVPQRSTYACDNMCEIMTSKIEQFGEEIFLTGTDCSNCDGCKEENHTFLIRTYENRIGFDYVAHVKGMHVMPTSEMLDINYCPWCGRRISEQEVSFEKCCLGTEIKIMNH